MSTVEPTKTCGKCKATKLLTDFVARKGARDGRSGKCKECERKRTYLWKISPRGMAKRKAHAAAYREVRVTPEARAKSKAAEIARLANPDAREKHRATKAAYRKTEKYAKSHREWNAAWKASPEGRKKHRAAHLAWTKTPSGQASIYRSTQKRRAIKAGVPIGDLNAIDAWEATWRWEDSVCCFWCERMFRGDECEADHVVPVSRDGPHCVKNLVIACIKCNGHKHNTLPEKFNPVRYAVWLASQAA